MLGGGEGRRLDGAVQSLGEQNLGEFGCFSFPGLMESHRSQTAASVSCARDVDLIPCLCQGCVNCGTHVRRRMETSPEGDTDAR